MKLAKFSIKAANALIYRGKLSGRPVGAERAR